MKKIKIFYLLLSVFNLYPILASDNNDQFGEVTSYTQHIKKLIKTTAPYIVTASAAGILVYGFFSKNRNSTITSLSDENDTLNSTITSLSDENNTLNSTIASLSDENETLNSKVISLSDVNHTLNSKVASLIYENKRLHNICEIDPGAFTTFRKTMGLGMMAGGKYIWDDVIYFGPARGVLLAVAGAITIFWEEVSLGLKNRYFNE